MAICLTKKELASAAGYTYRRLYDIDRDLPNEDKLFVPGESGKYDLALFVQRWVAYNLGVQQGKDQSLDEVKAIHELVKTRKTELEVARMEGQLVDVQDVRRLWADIANSVMQNLIRIPSKVAPLITMMDNAQAISGILDAEIREALEQVAETPLPDYAANNEPEEDDDELTEV